MKKKSVSLLLIFAFLITYCSFLNFNSASATVLHRNSFEVIALSFLRAMEPNQDYSTQNTETIYTLDEEIYGYKVNFKTKETGKDGYVIFNTEGGVAEFSYDSEGSAFDIYKDSKIYYNGALDYYFEDKEDSLVSILDGNEISKEEAKRFRNRNISKLKEIAYTDNATVSATGVITNPESTLTRIYSVENKNISNFDHTYGVTGAYSGVYSHGGPVAGVNLMIWFHNNGYTNLLSGQGWPYTTAFSQMRVYMNHVNFQDSTFEQVANGIHSYFHSKYNTNGWAKYTDINITHNKVYARVNQNIPVIYGVRGHSVYGTHFVLMVGYRKIVTYWYNIFGRMCFTDNLFMRVADGWTGNANRFVNFDDASIRTMVWLA